MLIGVLSQEPKRMFCPYGEGFQSTLVEIEHESIDHLLYGYGICIHIFGITN